MGNEVNEREAINEREWYRQEARRIYGHEGESIRLTIPTHSNVQPGEDGAFVEAAVWVPKEGLERRSE